MEIILYLTGIASYPSANDGMICFDSHTRKIKFVVTQPARPGSLLRYNIINLKSINPLNLSGRDLKIKELILYTAIKEMKISVFGLPNSLENIVFSFLRPRKMYDASVHLNRDFGCTVPVNLLEIIDFTNEKLVYKEYSQRTHTITRSNDHFIFDFPGSHGNYMLDCIDNIIYDDYDDSLHEMGIESIPYFGNNFSYVFVRSVPFNHWSNDLK